MKYLITGIIWGLTILIAYLAGWTSGVRNAASVAVSTTSAMSSMIGYLFVAVLIAIAAAVGIYYFRGSRRPDARTAGASSLTN